MAKMVQHGRLMEERMMPIMDMAKVLLYEIVAQLGTLWRSLNSQQAVCLLALVIDRRAMALSRKQHQIAWCPRGSLLEHRLQTA